MAEFSFTRLSELTKVWLFTMNVKGSLVLLFLQAPCCVHSQVTRNCTYEGMVAGNEQTIILRTCPGPLDAENLAYCCGEGDNQTCCTLQDFNSEGGDSISLYASAAMLFLLVAITIGVIIYLCVKHRRASSYLIRSTFTSLFGVGHHRNSSNTDGFINIPGFIPQRLSLRPQSSSTSGSSIRRFDSSTTDASSIQNPPNRSTSIHRFDSSTADASSIRSPPNRPPRRSGASKSTFSPKNGIPIKADVSKKPASKPKIAVTAMNDPVQPSTSTPAK